eukprot:1005707-Pelagomonas_calceolata.AAC.1
MPNNNRGSTGWVAMNVDGIPDTACDPESVKTEVLCATIRNHHISVLVETRTDDMDWLMRHLQGTHKLVHLLDVPAGCA